VGALIVPSFPALRDWANRNSVTVTADEMLIHEPRIVEFYKDLIESFNKYFNHVEQVKKFELLAHEWSIDTGEMTPKLSLKRKVIMEKYRDAIARIYS
jgi:long-chain acyl-CoA synthetase